MDKAYNPVIAHRGAWKKNNLPENSIAALKQAIAIKCQGSEFDIHTTKDGILVINHDDVFHGLPIEQNTYETLSKFTLSNGEKLPTLEEYIVKGKNKTTRLIFEIKPSPQGPAKGKQLATEVYKLVKRKSLETKVTFISFDREILKKLIDINKSVITQYLNGDKSPSELKALGVSGLDYHHSVFKTHHPEWIDEARRLSMQLNVWTVNEKSDLELFIHHKFDQITTNEPELLFEILRNKK